MHPPHVFLRLPAILLALSLAACGAFGGVFGKGVAFGGDQEITFRVAKNLNDDFPVAVELIVLYDEGLDAELSALSSREWFEQRQQYLRDFSSRQLATFLWEWPPGQSAPPEKFSYRSGALALLLFAGYSSPGEHRIRLDVPERPLMVLLDERDFRVEDR